MALITTEVKAYPLADSILTYLTQRSWIANDPHTYNYLDHYYLTKSRLDVYWLKHQRSACLDSLAAVCVSSGSPLDQLYYAPQLADLYAATHAYATAYRYRSLQVVLENQLAADKDFEKMQQALRSLFIRINRSACINKAFVTSYNADFIICNGEEFENTRYTLKELNQLLGE